MKKSQIKNWPQFHEVHDAMLMRFRQEDEAKKAHTGCLPKSWLSYKQFTNFLWAELVMFWSEQGKPWPFPAR